MNATDGYGEMCNDLRTSWDDEERVLNQARRSRKEVVRSIAQWLLSCTCFTVPMCPGTAPAMDFKIYAQPQLPLKMVIAEGRIQDGDAEKFTAFADMADRDEEGLVVLILNSPGGNVAAAFRVVDAMDKVRVYTTVPDNAKCASACASILFASGERRSVIGSGKLGFHSCYRREERSYATDSLCNEIIAANAMQRGISQVAINRFVKHYGARDMAWVGHDIACKSLQGLCKPGLLETRYQTRASLTHSLDCSKLISVQAQLICGDQELTRLDKRLAEIYGQNMKASSDKNRLRANQRAWIRSSRDVCSDKPCLLRSYRRRIDELKRMRRNDVN